MRKIFSKVLLERGMTLTHADGKRLVSEAYYRHYIYIIISPICKFVTRQNHQKISLFSLKYTSHSELFLGYHTISWQTMSRQGKG